jgi:hypothetical protein
MSPQPHRVRVLLSENGAERPPNTRVLFQQRLGMVMLLGAFLAVLCLPAHRRMLLTHAEGAFLRRMPEWIGMNWGLQDPAPDAAGREEARLKRLQKTLAQHPEDARLQLGAILSGAIPPAPENLPKLREEDTTFDPTEAREPRIEHLEALRARFPEDVVVRAHLLRYYSQGHLQIRRADDRLARENPTKRSVLLVPAMVDRIRQISDEGSRLEPENGYFPSMLAIARFAAGQDAAGLDALHRAAECGVWRDYAFEEAEAGREVLLRTYGDHGLWMRVMPWAAVPMPHFAQLRASARMALSAAAEARDRGDVAREHAIRADVIRLGALMRRDDHTLIGRLVGGAIEALGYHWDQKFKREINESQEALERRREAGRAAYIQRVRSEAPRYAAELERESAALSAFRAAQHEMGLATITEAPMRRGVARDLTALTLMANLGAALLLWLVAAAAGQGLRRARVDQAESAWRWFWDDAPVGVRIAGLGLLPFALLVPLATLPVSQELALVLTLICAVTLAILAVLARQPNAAEVPWPAGLTSLLAVITLGAAGSLLMGTGLFQLVRQYEWHVTPGLSLLNIGGDAPSGPTFYGISALPLGVALIGVTAIAALLRRAPLFSAVEAGRLLAKSVAGVLAVAYLIVLLVAVPQSERDAQDFLRAAQAEARLLP